jgi:hypothetical protein
VQKGYIYHGSSPEEAAGAVGGVPKAPDRYVFESLGAFILRLITTAELENIVEARQKLESQLQENRGVQQVDTHDTMFNGKVWI